MGMQDGRLTRSEASKKAILNAAISIVETAGLSCLTHRGVAAAAGVSHALVTYHFATAAALRRATFGHANDRLTGELSLLLADLQDPTGVPRMGSEFAVRMVTGLRAEAFTTYELLLAASRDPELQPIAIALIDGIADLLEPATGDRERAKSASIALLGNVLASMATGMDHDLEAFRVGVGQLIDHFDPRRGPAEGPGPSPGQVNEPAARYR